MSWTIPRKRTRSRSIARSQKSPRQEQEIQTEQMKMKMLEEKKFSQARKRRARHRDACPAQVLLLMQTGPLMSSPIGRTGRGASTVFVDARWVPTPRKYRQP